MLSNPIMATTYHQARRAELWRAFRPEIKIENDLD